jgi:hypothetical protein
LPWLRSRAARLDDILARRDARLLARLAVAVVRD